MLALDMVAKEPVDRIRVVQDHKWHIVCRLLHWQVDIDYQHFVGDDLQATINSAAK
jgi:hypothetical protein